MIVDKQERKIEKCDNRFKCLTEKKKDCECVHRPVTYTANERMTIKEVAEFYKRDVCAECMTKTFCDKKGYVMKFKGSSGRNGPWQNAVTINKKNTYPLFRYKIWCKAYDQFDKYFR
jgi:hypothetical protein